MFLLLSLACPGSGLPSDACTLGLLPVTLDTPMNRKFMPDADQWALTFAKLFRCGSKTTLLWIEDQWADYACCVCWGQTYHNDASSVLNIKFQEHLDPIGRSGSHHGGLVKGEGEEAQWIFGDLDWASQSCSSLTNILSGDTEHQGWSYQPFPCLSTLSHPPTARQDLIRSSHFHCKTCSDCHYFKGINIGRIDVLCRIFFYM